MRSENTVFVALARLTRHRWRLTWTLVALAAVSVVLGVIGWIQVARSDGSSVDGWAVVYGTIGLFAFVPDVEGAPWPLAVARVTAPVTTVGAALAALLAFADTRIHRRAASSARDHLVLYGPSERIGPYLSAAFDHVRDGGIVVRLDLDQEIGDVTVAGADDDLADRVTTVSVAVRADPFGLVRDRWDRAAGPAPTDWVVASGAAAARSAVIATGRDEWNIEALGVALDSGLPGERRRLTVEIDDRSTALRLAVAFAAERTDEEIQVVCRDEVLARRAVGRLLDSASATRVDAEGPDLTIVGDGPMVQLVVMELGRRLNRRHVDGLGHQRLPLEIIDPDPDRAASLQQRVRSGRLEVRTSHDPHRLLDDRRPVRAFVDFADPQRSLRFALELAASSPDHSVWGLFGPGPLPFDRLVSLDDREELSASDLVGPFTRAAADATAAGTPVTAGMLRAMTADLVTHGWSLVPTTGTNAPTELDRATIERLASVASSRAPRPGEPAAPGVQAAMDLAEDFPTLADAVGLALVEPRIEG